MEKIVSFVDVIIGNEEDASDVFGIKEDSTNITKGVINQDAYFNVAQKLSVKFSKVKYVAITLRESISASHNNWGAMLYEKESDNAFFAPLDVQGSYIPYQITHIVDRVGGGDSFAAGLIFAMNSDKLKEPGKAVSFAVAASCLKHSIEGDFNYVGFDEVMRLMEGDGSGRVVR